jgi:hypothetical protein
LSFKIQHGEALDPTEWRSYLDLKQNEHGSWAIFLAGGSSVQTATTRRSSKFYLPIADDASSESLANWAS